MKKIFFCLLLIIVFSNSWGARKHTVEPGDHVLDILIAHQYPMHTEQQKQRWLDEVMRLNKPKFIWGEIDLIRPGSVLTLPTHPEDLKVPDPIVTAEFDKLIKIAEMQIQQGYVNIQSKQGNSRKGIGTISIYEGDTLISSSSSQAKITLLDSAKFELSSDSKIVFEHYQYQPQSPHESNALIRFYRGAMRATTGLIGQFAPEKFDVRTPVIAIGIRGTDYVARHCEGSGCGDYAGSSIAVTEGGVATRTRAGSADINKGQFIQADDTGELSEVSDIPKGFLDLDKDITQIESPLNWWQRALKQIQTIITH